MRLSRLLSIVLLLTVATPALAQDYVEFVSRQDRVMVTFPTQPTVTETTFKSQFGADLPARVYKADSAIGGHFVLTVADYNNVEALDTARSKACPVGAETCLGGGSSTGAGYWKADIQGAIIYATWQMIERAAKVTAFEWNNISLVEGHMLAFTNPDKSRTSAGVYMHENKLYILEGTVPPGLPPADFFPQSLQWLDENGKAIRYITTYHNGFPKPAMEGPGGQRERLGVQ